MIRELITYLFERPTLTEAKSFGHLTESIALNAREKRCHLAWKSHRAHCKNFIIEHLSIARHFESVLVLGTGPLHEIPIEELARTFKKVVLVDIVHLKSTKKSIAHLKNVEFLEHEISEIECVLKEEKKIIEKIPTSFLCTDWGLVLSVNLMSQLPLHLDSYIKKKLKNKFPMEEVSLFLKKVTANHLFYLKKFICPTILITDIETNYLDRAGNLLQKDISFAHLNLPETSAQWEWNIAPIPEFDKLIQMKMLVAAYIFNSIK